MVEDSPLLAVHRTLKTELGRSVYNELRHIAASGSTEAADSVAALARRVQQSWDEVTSVSKLHGGPHVNSKWVSLLQAKHRKLDELTRDLDAAERAFAWSKVLYEREEAYIRDVTVKAFGEAGDPGITKLDKLVESTFDYDEASYLESVTIMARILAKLQEEEQLVELRLAHVAERKSLREQLQNAHQARSDMQVRRKGELDRLYEYLEGAGISLDKDDFPPDSQSPEARANEEILAARGGEGREAKPPSRRKRQGLVRSRAPRLETSQRVRYWDSYELEDLQLAGEFDGRPKTGPPAIGRAATSRAEREELSLTPLFSSLPRAEKMYKAPGSAPSAPSSARNPRLNPRLQAPWDAASLGGPAKQQMLPTKPSTAGGEARPRAWLPTPPSTAPAGMNRQQRQESSRQGSEELLLLGSSHRIVSEGARGGALVFWLEPPEGEDACGA